MRVWKAVSIMAVSAACHVSSPALPANAGCLTCDQGLECVATDQGAKFCLQGPLTCTLAIPCFGGPRRTSDGSEEMTTWSLFELDGGGEAGIEGDAGPLAVGEPMRSRAVGTGSLVDATLAFGEDLAVLLADEWGDGFAVRRTAAGGRAHVEVLEVAGDRPGRVIADALLAERDRLRVRVRVEGRDRWLVLQASRVPAAARDVVVDRLRGSLRDAAAWLPGRARPLLEVRAL